MKWNGMKWNGMKWNVIEYVLPHSIVHFIYKI
jgi:hypothetical protein